MDWGPLQLTAKLAFVTTALLFFISLPLSYWLARSRAAWKIVPEALTGLPLVLPPSVLGFYLLLAFSPSSALGRFLQETLHLNLVFSFEGLLVGSILYSLPFMVQPLQSGFAAIPDYLREASFSLGKSPWQTLFKVELPNMRTAILTALILTFAHTVGEFGVVLMIGGNIPGETRVASIALYDEVEMMNYAGAHRYAAVLTLTSFVILLIVYGINRYYKAKRIL